MKKIEIYGRNGTGKYALVDDDDFKLVSGRKWYITKFGYLLSYVNKNGKYTHEYMHRVIANPVNSMVVDHINRNRLDNRRSNLRICTRAENTYNSGIGKNNTTGFKGLVRTKSKKWEARIIVKRKCISLGRYTTKEDAALAYNEAAIKYFGKFAGLNTSLLLK